MSIVSVKCPICEAKIQLDDERPEGFCSYCGSKVKIEKAQEAKILGTVKVDSSDELKNLYQIARRAKDSENSENAQKYYDMILIKDPISWEATFYVTYYQAMQCKIAEIWSAANSVMNCEPAVLELVKEYVSEEEQNDVVTELYTRLSSISLMFFTAAKNHYEGIDAQIQADFLQEYINNAAASADVMYACGNLLIETFEDKYGAIAALAWKEAINIHREYVKYLIDKESNIKIIEEFSDKIKKYDSSYKMPIIETKTGCYVATAIYGSYNCPEVWTLRRFRDFSLAKTWHGRVFIKAYYTISPTLVKWFGKTIWFKKLWKPTLDNIVKKLQDKGFDATPYKDCI